MGSRPLSTGNTLHAPGIYQRIKNYELTVALRPDPRLLLGDLPDDERAALQTQPFAPTALGQPEALMQGLPVMVPRWYVGGRSYREFRGWPPYNNRRVKWFVVCPDDTVAPGSGPAGGFVSERAVKRAARCAGCR